MLHIKKITSPPNEWCNIPLFNEAKKLKSDYLKQKVNRNGLNLFTCTVFCQAIVKELLGFCDLTKRWGPDWPFHNLQAKMFQVKMPVLQELISIVNI